ncbi:PAS domain-containing sensor histidine kinase [Adhaeribacter aquaticus]|uniref:PAS domain-containing sensor histidine kinase n=1 Tax=Adhaeribacter aquaticus TaxID=299567 RepID=UPI00040E8CC6|nr:PAS domain-containing sensor histidine kinase [Adhaeribacter aquaticus]
MSLDNFSTLSFLTALTESADIVVFAYDITTNRFTYLNPAFEKIWHKKRKTAIDNPSILLKTIHPEDKAHIQAVYQDLLEGNIVPETEFRIKLRNDIVRWVCIKPMHLEDHGLISGFITDVTVQKDYNNYLKKFSDKKNAILHILSHDLAGPLNNIDALSDLLASDLKEGKIEEAQNTVDIIQRSSKQGIQLIQEFLKQEFLESTGTEVIKRRVDLVAAIKQFIEEYQRTQQLTHKTFTYLPAMESLYLELDDNKFMQVINNLISNAIKFTPDGGEITISLEEKEATVLIQVKDTGIGIPGQFHATLFDKFTQARRPGIKGEPSVGLGMSIIKTIVEWHNGHIWFESQENKGTTFYIEVPKN